MSTKKLVTTLNDAATAFAASKGSTHCAFGFQDGSVQLVPENEPNNSINIQVFQNTVLALCFAPIEFGLMLACGSSAGSIAIFQLHSEKEITLIYEERFKNECIRCLDFSEIVDSKTENTDQSNGIYMALAAGCSSGNVILTQLDHQMQWSSQTCFVANCAINDLKWLCLRAINPNFTHKFGIVAGTIDGSLYYCGFSNSNGLDLLFNHKFHCVAINSIAVTIDYSLIASIDESGLICVVELKPEGAVLNKMIKQTIEFTQSIVWSPDNTQLFTADQFGTLKTIAVSNMFE